MVLSLMKCLEEFSDKTVDNLISEKMLSWLCKIIASFTDNILLNF